MVKVCNAIMGAGKTEAAINHMNTNADCKFIFITPYLDEAKRIKDSCPALNFVEPNNKLKEFGFSKSKHTAALVKNGRNISTTHEAFKYYTAEMLEDIKRWGYHLIIDESINILEELSVDSNDINLLIESGYLKNEDGFLTKTEKKYTGKMFGNMWRMLDVRELISFEDKSINTHLFYWTLPPNLITSFNEVIVLTYLFRGQGLYYFFKLYDIEYNYIGVNRRGGKFEFCSPPGYMPEYVQNIRSHLIILDNEKLNAIGDDRYALSMSWFKKNKTDIKQLKNNTYNYFRNINSNIPSDKRMWATYNAQEDIMKGKGYTKGFVTFNLRATNQYRNRTCLVYLTNIFMNVGEKLFYESHGLEVDEDLYALSTMVQWIWRSAIRDGQPIYLYIPSKRMRTILTDWLDSLDREVRAVE